MHFLFLLLLYGRVQAAGFFGGGDEQQGEENQGEVKLKTKNSGLFDLKWENNPFDVPIGLDRNFSQIQTVLTLPHYTKEVTGEVPGGSKKPGEIRPKNYATLKLQEFGDMENGQLSFDGPFKLRLRWSPEMMAAGALYALLKIQNVINPRVEPPINETKKLLYNLDDPTYVLKTSVRKSLEYKWVLQRAKALAYAFWGYRKDPKYAPEVAVEKFAEHRELVTSLKRFLGDQEARDQATDIISIFKKHRYPMNPMNMLMIMKKLLTKALKSSGDQLDVARYECTLKPSVSGVDLDNINISINCTKEEIDDPA